MGPGRGHLERALGGCLTPDIGEIEVVRNPGGHQGVRADADRSDRAAARQMVAHLGKVLAPRTVRS